MVTLSGRPGTEAFPRRRMSTKPPLGGGFALLGGAHTADSRPAQFLQLASHRVDRLIDNPRCIGRSKGSKATGTVRLAWSRRILWHLPTNSHGRILLTEDVSHPSRLWGCSVEEFDAECAVAFRAVQVDWTNVGHVNAHRMHGAPYLTVSRRVLDRIYCCERGGCLVRAVRARRYTREDAPVRRGSRAGARQTGQHRVLNRPGDQARHWRRPVNQNCRDGSASTKFDLARPNASRIGGRVEGKR